jgi:hypothetical protein
MMDTQINRAGRRKRRRKSPAKKPAIKAEPVVVAARRPDSPRLEKTTRRMKAASAKPRTLTDASLGQVVERPVAELDPAELEARRKRREARIVVRKEDEIDDTEKTRRRLLSRYLAAEGRVAVTKAANEYSAAGFDFPREQEAQLKLLEHFDEAKAEQAVIVLRELLEDEAANQLPLFRQRLRRLEDHAESPELRELAGQLRRSLPA